MDYKELAGRTFEINSKHTGWISKVSFSRWQKYGKDRLYYRFAHYDRKGNLRNHHDGKGYIDLQSGEVQAPPSDKRMIQKIMS